MLFGKGREVDGRHRLLFGGLRLRGGFGIFDSFDTLLPRRRKEARKGPRAEMMNYILVCLAMVAD